MAVLRLVYFDTNNEERTVSVDKDIFTVGRSSENDLSVPDSRLSRDHLEIERAYGEFTARDVGSSNGTKHNGYELRDAVVIRHGDEFDLGGGVLLKAIVEDAANEAPPEPAAETAPAAKRKTAPAAAASSGSSSSLLTTLILVVPAAGIVLLLLVGGVFLLVGSSGNDDGNDQAYSDQTETDSGDDATTVSTPTPKKDSNDDPGSSSDPSDGGGANDGAAASPTPAAETPETLAEKHGAEFLRAIAHNEPRAFLTGEQSRIVVQKIKSIASPALAENIRSAKSNASQIKTIAAAQNLKPQILAAAAIAKMGGGRGDVVQTAKTMAETLSVLRTQIGQEFGDDVLLMIAAYDQGAAGDTMKMRNMLQGLTGKYQVSTRTIRSIWFLKKNDLITDQQYDLALRFLAVGTVMQNPKAFNVYAEPVVF